MARKGLCVLACAAVLAGATLLLVVPRGGAGPAPAGDDEHEKKLLNLLAVQKALQDGRDCLKRGDYQAAVLLLEARVAYIDGSKEYLGALREAYIGYIRELKQANRTAETATYLRRLECCDPGALLELNGPRTAAFVRSAADAPAPFPLPAAKSAETVAAPPPPDDGAGKTKAALERADQEFSAQHYAEAGKLYDQVNQADPNSLVAGTRERWAYCKLYNVVGSLNAKADAAAGPELEREVRLAMTLAPKNQVLDAFGKNLLGKIQERRGATVRAAAPDRVEDAAPAPASVEVRHKARGPGENWSVAETANFRIFHNQTREIAEKAARTAEAARTAASKKWFGDAGTTAWNPRCDLYLHATAQDYAAATGVPADSPGHSTMSTEGERVVGRRIDMHCDDPNAFIGVLPHESTHVVLAGRFGAHAVPRWADEGMAVLSEPRERIDRHLNNLPRHRQEGALFPVGTLMQSEKYPEGRLIGPFYAESVSLVEYLSKQKGPQTFSQFLRDSLDGGYEPALQRYYGIKDFGDLEQRWQRAAFAGGVAERDQ